MNPNTVQPVPIRNETVEAERQQATDQPANMTNQQESEEKRKDDQPKLNLNYSTRDQLIGIFNQLSAILKFDEPIPRDAQQRICQKIAESVGLLVWPFEPSQRDGKMFEEKILSQMTVQLGRDEQSRVIKHLMVNQDAILNEQATEETKRSLATENDAIVFQLLKLPCRKQSAKDKNGVEPAPKKQRVESGTSLSEQLDHLKAITKSQGELAVGLEARMNEMKSELKQEIEKVDITRPEVSFKFEMVDVSKFFESDCNERHSDRFWCQGLQWSIKVKRIQEDDLSKILGFYLFCHNDDQLKWSCKADCKLILFSHLSEAQNRVRELVHTYDKKKGFGYRCFISYRELTDQENGYIQDDKVILAVDLKAEPVFTESKAEDSKTT